MGGGIYYLINQCNSLRGGTYLLHLTAGQAGVSKSGHYDTQRVSGRLSWNQRPWAGGTKKLLRWRHTHTLIILNPLPFESRYSSVAAQSWLMPELRLMPAGVSTSHCVTSSNFLHLSELPLPLIHKEITT
jgi:hypothetical protein